jgi:sialate O-acetylesterase
MKSILLFLLTTAFIGQANAQLTIARLFNNHMVLQRNQAIPVWGWAKKKAKVTVGFNNQLISTKADEMGYWKVTLKPMPEGGPYTMMISAGKEKLTYADVMLGEVWLCSGQSNMEFQLKNALGYRFEQKNAAQMPIRQFQVPDKMSLTPEKDISGGEWIKADTNTVGNFTAVGYFFAKKLAQQLHVTVGLIYSNWGGTQVEDWISKDAMLASPELSAAAKKLPDTWDELKTRDDNMLKAFAYKGGSVINYTADQLAAEPADFFNNWQVANSPGPWEWEGKFYSYRGQGFMQRSIRLDSAVAAHPSSLQLGQTDADAEVFVNGKLISNGALTPGKQFDLPAGIWKAGDNSLLFDLQSLQKNPSWFGVGLNGSAANLFIRFADTTINLASPGWRLMPDLSKPYHFNYLPNNTGFSLYNAMINPLIPYAIAGVIWYQGESNTDRAYEYRSSFPLMISDWRNRWKQDFPFLFVQLASFGSSQNSNAGSNWAELREAQTMTLQLPKTGMAITTDIGDAFNIHPGIKPM